MVDSLLGAPPTPAVALRQDEQYSGVSVKQLASFSPAPHSPADSAANVVNHFSVALSYHGPMRRPPNGATLVSRLESKRAI
jgi:hypothetical protein